MAMVSSTCGGANGGYSNGFSSMLPHNPSSDSFCTAQSQLDLGPSSSQDLGMMDARASYGFDSNVSSMYNGHARTPSGGPALASFGWGGSGQAALGAEGHSPDADEPGSSRLTTWLRDENGERPPSRLTAGSHASSGVWGNGLVSHGLGSASAWDSMGSADEGGRVLASTGAAGGQQQSGEQESGEGSLMNRLMALMCR